ncbi:hypothetical protein FHX48_000649 [Microbacterium halimionae]|uniref:Uncharacterized protein n=1 Tax=Microbacterium halimionae TaxID=1526413 RepID=A0A7W3JMI6_9MICO|nr:hypothetical protein [Microbacterium halimionae]NII95643.1 hypothetical protein [Microbacterium halimionae]
MLAAGILAILASVLLAISVEVEPLFIWCLRTAGFAALLLSLVLAWMPHRQSGIDEDEEPTAPEGESPSEADG